MNEDATTDAIRSVNSIKEPISETLNHFSLKASTYSVLPEGYRTDLEPTMLTNILRFLISLSASRIYLAPINNWTGCATLGELDAFKVTADLHSSIPTAMGRFPSPHDFIINSLFIKNYRNS